MDSKHLREKRKMWIVRRKNNSLAAGDVTRLYGRSKKEKSQDTILRMEMQMLIKELINKGETVQKVIETLSQNSNYSKYAVYFPSWIENCQRKQQPKKQREDEER